MKRGGIRTNRKYVTEEDGTKKIKYEIQGKKNKLWFPIVETIDKVQVPMIYDTIQEAEKQLKVIVKQVRGKDGFKRR
jgi:diaminopimelate epimerase